MGFLMFLKKVWNFIWHDNSVWSWLVNFVLAFVIIKFVIYPVLGFLLGTSAPIVAVVSGSMEHSNGFEEWWFKESCCDDACSLSAVQSVFYDDLNISFDSFKKFSFKNGFNKGDIMFLVSPKNIDVGDVIVYSAGIVNDPVIHRIVNLDVKEDNVFFTTKGDRNCGIADFEKNLSSDKIIGKAVFRIPFLGWIKIIFVEFVNFIAGLVR